MGLQSFSSAMLWSSRRQGKIIEHAEFLRMLIGMSRDANLIMSVMASTVVCLHNLLHSSK